MQIAVLSGKGGTGKTFVAVNLAYAKGSSFYIDCDVEEPNGRLFLKPEVKQLDEVNVMVPAVAPQLCTGCRKCVELCKFNALAYIKNKLLVFHELCHACKGCVLMCPQKALSESGKHIGYIEYGMSGEVEVITGVLNTGEATGVPIIRKLLSVSHGRQLDEEDRTVILDCPPGSACSVMESIKEADYCLMVAEPTIFGLHNLDMVYKLVKLFKKPHALIINKDTTKSSPQLYGSICEQGDKNLIEKYCFEKDIKIIASIPYASELALVNSQGLIAAKEHKMYLNLFKEISDKIRKEAGL